MLIFHTVVNIGTVSNIATVSYIATVVNIGTVLNIATMLNIGICDPFHGYGDHLRVPQVAWVSCRPHVSLTDNALPRMQREII
jgi:hypothetical protein